MRRGELWNLRIHADLFFSKQENILFIRIEKIQKKMEDKTSAEKTSKGKD